MRPIEEQLRGVDVALVLGWPQPTGRSGAPAARRHQLRGLCGAVVLGRARHAAAPERTRTAQLPLHPHRHGFRDGPVALQARRRARVGHCARLAVVDNAHRDMVRDLAIAGAGAARLLDWSQRKGGHIASGLLVPALTDWEHEEVPPVNLLYPPSVRRIPRVRRFIDFATQLFRDIEQQRQVRAPSTAMPPWIKAYRRLRASATLKRVEAVGDAALASPEGISRPARRRKVALSARCCRRRRPWCGSRSRRSGWSFPTAPARGRSPWPPPGARA